MKIESMAELENEFYKIQIKGLELDGKYLFIRGIILDIGKDEAFEFEDGIDLSDWDEDTDKENTNIEDTESGQDEGDSK